MRKLLLRFKSYRTMARLALIASEKTLKDVKDRDVHVDEVTAQSRLLREENHFKETIKEAMRWS